VVNKRVCAASERPPGGISSSDGPPTLMTLSELAAINARRSRDAGTDTDTDRQTDWRTLALMAKRSACNLCAGEACSCMTLFERLAKYLSLAQIAQRSLHLARRSHHPLRHRSPTHTHAHTHLELSLLHHFFIVQSYVIIQRDISPSRCVNN